MIKKNVKYYWIFRFNYIFDIQLKYNNQNDIGNFSYATLLARKPSPRNWLAANSLFFPKKSVCFSEWPRSGGALPTARPRPPAAVNKHDAQGNASSCFATTLILKVETYIVNFNFF